MIRVDFSDLNNFHNNLIKFSRYTTSAILNNLKEWGEGVVDRAKSYAPVFKGNLRDNIVLEDVKDNSFVISSNAYNSVTGEYYGYVQETGDYSVSKFNKLPMSYSLLNVNVNLIDRMREWASMKAPSLLKRVKWITPKGYTPHITPAINEGISNVEEFIKRGFKIALKESKL